MTRSLSLLASFCLSLVLVNRPVAAAPQSLEDIVANLRSQIIFAIAKRDVDQLEKMAESFRTSRSRAPDGYWHHHYFHRIINELPVGKGRMESIEGWTEIVAQWKSKYPASPTPDIVMASRYAAEGWAARGSGTADTVWDDARKVLRDNMTKAREILLSSKALAQDDPEWFARLAQVELIASNDRASFMAVIEEGLKREPTYYKLANVAFIYLLPQWHGRPGEAEAWARTVAERYRADEGDSLYARIYAMHLRNADPRRVVHEFDIDWPRMKRGINELLVRYTEPELGFVLLGLSCAANDAEQVIAIWKTLGTKHEAFRHQEIDPATKCGWQPQRQAQGAPGATPAPVPQQEPNAGPTQAPRTGAIMPRPGPRQYISN